jgi:hypothetical protein
MTRDDIKSGVAALERLLEACRQHQGHSTAPILAFLASLYNDMDFQVPAARLCRRITDQDFADVITVMRLSRATNREPHEFFENGGAIWYELTEPLRPRRRRRRS